MLKLHLQLFAEGEGGENAAGGIDFDSEFEKQFGIKSSGSAAPKEERAKPDEKPEQDAAADDQPNTEDKPDEDPEQLFEQLIKGKFKEQFGKKVQGIINERFKSNNAKLTAAEQRVAQIEDAFAAYTQRLGVDVKDLEAVKKAVLDDKTNFRAQALEKGITVEEAVQEFQQEREAAKLEESKNAMRQAADAQREDNAVQAIYQQWEKDAEEIKQSDPGFDLRREIEGNPDFANALNAGMSVKFAYRATHYDDQMAKVAVAVEKQTAINTAQQIASGQNRPTEGGLRTSAASQSKVDYSNLPTEDFMALFNKSLKGRI